MAAELNYAELAIYETKVYIERLNACLEGKDKDRAKKVRELFEQELRELYWAFRMQYPEESNLQGSFWDFITELQNTPMNYEKSLEDLLVRSPWFCSKQKEK